MTPTYKLNHPLTPHMRRSLIIWISLFTLVFLLVTVLSLSFFDHRRKQSSSINDWQTYTNETFHYSLSYPSRYCVTRDNVGVCLKSIPIQVSEFSDGVVIKPVQTLNGEQMVTSTDISNTNFEPIDQINVIAGSVVDQKDLEEFVQNKLAADHGCILEALYPTKIPEIMQFTITIRGEESLADYSPNAVWQQCPLLQHDYRAVYDKKNQIAFIMSDASILSPTSTFDHLTIAGIPFRDMGIKNNPGKNNPKLTFYRRHTEDLDSTLDVDDPIISGFHDKTLENSLNVSLKHLEIPINNWRRNPFYGEKNVFQRRCSPLAVNELVIRFTCITQSWFGDKTDGPFTEAYTLNAETGEWIEEASVNQAPLLTTKDFPGGSGRSGQRPNETQDIFTVLINPELPPYTFHVRSFATTTNTQGSIEIFRDEDTTKPRQTILLNPNMRFRDMVPVFFTAQDINFDGYADIGVPIDGGAKWSSYQYWVFNPETGMFITTEASKDLEKIGFNFISFDQKNNQIITDNLSGSGWRTLYQFQAGRIIKIKEEQLNNIIQHDAKEFTDHPTFHCRITTTDYSKGRARVTDKNILQECERSMHTIPFEYPVALSER